MNFLSFNLTELAVFFLDNNHLSFLPASIGNLTALEFLDIRKNPWRDQSQLSIIQLRRLRERECYVRCDAVVGDAIEALPEIPGEPPPKQQKFL